MKAKDLGITSLFSVLFLVSLSFLSLIGTYLVNSYCSNIVLLLSIAMIALLVWLISFGVFVPKRLYPLAVFIVAISLLYQNSLVPQYLTGWDIHYEYYLANLVKTNSFWDSTIYHTYNAMLSIVMLAPVYCIISAVDLTRTLKVIYPFLLSFVPVVLYEVFRKQTNEKAAFLSVFFFMSFFTFFSEMLQLARQQIAEIFFALLISVIMVSKINPRKKALLISVFSVSLIVSHYGLSYIYLFYLCVPLLFWLFTARTAFKNAIVQKMRRSKKRLNSSSPMPRKTITVTYVLFYASVALAWYFYVSGSRALVDFINIADHIFNSILIEFLVPQTREHSILMTLGFESPYTWSLQREIHRILFVVTNLLIMAGVLEFVKEYKKMKVSLEYAAMVITSVLIISLSIVLPYFAKALHMTRIYHVTLFFLAPFFVFGAEVICRTVLAFKTFSLNVIMGSSKKERGVKHGNAKQIVEGQTRNEISTISGNTRQKHVDIKSIFLVSVLTLYFLFNTGFIYEVTRDTPYSISLSIERMKISSDLEVRVEFTYAYTYDQEVLGAEWLSRYKGRTADVFADYIAKWHVLASYGMMSDDTYVLSNNTRIEIRADTYIYLRYINIIDGVMSWRSSDRLTTYDTVTILPVIAMMSKIYSNDGCDVYYR